VPSLSTDGGRDLVVIALPGVQRFIRESRSTSDTRSASEIVAELAAYVAAEICASPGCELVIPAPDSAGTDAGMPNRVVALAPAGSGEELARRVKLAVEERWSNWVSALKLPHADTSSALPGFPGTQWVCVPCGSGGYPEQWERAQSLLSARKRVRDFTPVEELGRELCMMSPQWPATTKPPPNTRSFGFW